MADETNAARPVRPDSLGSSSNERGTLHVRCPHCHDQLDLTDDSSLETIQCPMCGSCFSLFGAQTTETYCLEHPRRIAQFELIEQVGFGHVGCVWKARDTELERTVAVKIPRKGQLDPSEAERFLREARAAAQVRHPNVVSIHEVGRDGNLVYIVSDFIDGANLSEWLTGQRLTSRESAELCVKIANALHEAHEAGVIHRDLKPGNIMLDLTGEPYITDFGLARREFGEITVTVEGRVLGTPAYMSPEQARGEAHRADRRTDVYSCGVILYQLLTGEIPFRGDPRMLIVQILHDEPVAPRKLNARVPPDLQTICLKCLEKDPDQRYPNARALRDEIGRFLAGDPIQARPVGTLGRVWRWYRRHPDASMKVAGGYATFCAILLLVWGISGIALYALGIDPAQDRQRAILEIVGVIVGVYLPLLWSGIRTLNGSVLGLWSGVLASLVGLVLAGSGWIGVVAYAGAFGDPRLRVPLFLLLTELCLVGLLVHAFAIASRYSKHPLDHRGP